jgi:hypothetical protein
MKGLNCGEAWGDIASTATAGGGTAVVAATADIDGLALAPKEPHGRKHKFVTAETAVVACSSDR